MEDEKSDQSSNSSHARGGFVERGVDDGSSTNESTATKDFSDTDSTYRHSKGTSLDLMSRWTKVFAVLILLIGSAASASFLFLGITYAKDDESAQFERHAIDLVREIESAWFAYEVAGSWIHEACRSRNVSRTRFRGLYEYLKAGGLDFQAAEFVPNVTHEERDFYEQEARDFYAQEYPDLSPPYRGFVGFEPSPDDPSVNSVQTRSNQSFYFPVHYVEPVVPNAAAIDLDLYSSPKHRRTINTAIRTWKPTLTRRLQLVQETDKNAYSVLLIHPGVPLPFEPSVQPRDVSLMVIRIPSLLERATSNKGADIAVYIYDATDSLQGTPPQFLGAAAQRVTASEESEVSLRFPKEIEYSDLQVQYSKEADDGFFFEENLEIGSSKWNIVVVPVEGSYDTTSVFVILGGAMILAGTLFVSVFMVLNMQRAVKMNQIVEKAQAENRIVSSLFPTTIRDRLVQDALELQGGSGKSRAQNSASVKSFSRESAQAYSTKPIAEFFSECSVLFSDISGFTAWSSVREPSQVFMLLEAVYNGFDKLARRQGIFKVETIGDCYVAVAGVPNPRRDHAEAMVRFARKAAVKMNQVVQNLEMTLGPETADLAMRFGIHSGPVTAGVLRGEKSRFQLFGDTVNVAARMESTGTVNRIHLSEETANILIAQGKESWVKPRESKVQVKGKGEMQTYWLVFDSPTNNNQAEVGSDGSPSLLAAANLMTGEGEPQDRLRALVLWNTEVLHLLLKKVVVMRRLTNGRVSVSRPQTSTNNLKIKHIPGATVLDEVKESIALPEKMLIPPKDITEVQLDPKVALQLKNFVTSIANMYHDHCSFHSVEHASHVVQSVCKLLQRIMSPEMIDFPELGRRESLTHQDVHDLTYGLTSDPLTQFAVVFSALIHDVDHQGVPNTTLVREESEVARHYNNKSVAEQNSVDLAWELLMEPSYADLRACIYQSKEELFRFRQIVVNTVLATDIMDKELGTLRKQRWEKAFHKADSILIQSNAEAMNRRATIVIEHLIQASDVAHTMQHWHIYVKWNERLFHEMYKAYVAGRAENDPSVGWYKGEIGFFDFYVIPLAKKLKECGVFGVSSAEYLNYALANRTEWEKKGEATVKIYLSKYQK